MGRDGGADNAGAVDGCSVAIVGKELWMLGGRVDERVDLAPSATLEEGKRA